MQIFRSLFRGIQAENMNLKQLDLVGGTKEKVLEELKEIYFLQKW